MPSAVVCLGLLLSAVASAPPAEDRSIENICKLQTGYFESIDTIEFSSAQVLSLSEVAREKLGQASARTESSLTFAAKSAKFLSSTALRDPATGAESIVVTAYDGNRHQMLDKTSRLLSVSNRPQMANAYFGLNPVLVPFLFVFERDDEQTLVKLRDEATWARLVAEARGTGVERVGEHTCDVFEFTRRLSGHPVTYAVYFSRESGGLPVRTLMRDSDGKLLYEAAVERLERVGGVVVPLRVVIRGYIPDTGEQWQTVELTIDRETLKVNEPLDDGTFSIPVTEADYFVDVDAGMQVPMATDEWLRSEVRKGLSLPVEETQVAPAAGLAALPVGRSDKTVTDVDETAEAGVERSWLLIAAAAAIVIVLVWVAVRRRGTVSDVQ